MKNEKIFFLYFFHFSFEICSDMNNLLHVEFKSKEHSKLIYIAVLLLPGKKKK